ncbi:elongation factor Ts [Candidatus Kaiserbacteria bacterium]|nr:elongation factor Ts [Candidatus Kaiserbacteria bacterium]
MVTMDQIKELRELTGISVMQCKKALEEAQGDMEKAKVILRKQGSDIALKKSERGLGAGVVESYIHNTKQVGAIVVLSCETDFVAKNEGFIQLAREIAMQVAATAPQFSRREDVTEEDTSAAEEVFRKEIEEQVGDKPKEMQEKILQGKIDSFLKEKILLEQDYIKDSSLTIKGLIDSATQKFGENIAISHFARYSVK